MYYIRVYYLQAILAEMKEVHEGLQKDVEIGEKQQVWNEDQKIVF
jgi:hypothetical protein